MTERKNDDQSAVATRPISGQYGAPDVSGKSVETVDQDSALFIGPETCGHAKTVERCIPREIEPADLTGLA